MNNNAIISAIKTRFGVEEEQINKFALYLQYLQRWNKKINLTSVESGNTAWELHIYDSLLAATYLHGNEKLLDIGSGAGLPTIPLKILFPQLVVRSVDSVKKKIHFQKHCVRNMGLKNYYPTAERIEMSSTDEKYDIVISRAYASLAKFIEVALPLMTERGRIIALKSTAVEVELEKAAAIMQENNLIINRQMQEKLPFSGAHRVVIEIIRID